MTGAEAMTSRDSAAPRKPARLMRVPPSEPPAGRSRRGQRNGRRRPMPSRLFSAVILAATLFSSRAEAQSSQCAPSPIPAGNTITLGPSDSARLPGVVQNASAGTVILLRDGTYRLTSAALIFRNPRLTLRSASGDARKVVLDGGYKTNEIFMIAASGTTIADITITHAVDHLVHLVPPARNTIQNIRLTGLRLIDAGEQFVKANPDAGRTAFVDDATVECSVFEMTDEGRTHVETLGGTSCYTGGIDVHGGRGWKVRHNRFEGLFCRTGFMSEHAVHFWRESRDTLVENNLIINCARGIGFGLGQSGPATRRWDDIQGVTGYVGHQGGMIRNNIIVADIPEYDTGIGLEQARGARVIHNTVFAAPGTSKAFSSIDARFANTSAEIHNNLVNNITLRENPAVTASHNLEQVTARDFAGAARMDFHLRAGSRAIDAGITVEDAGLDMDGEARGARPDVGADEKLRGSGFPVPEFRVRLPGSSGTSWRTGNRGTGNREPLVLAHREARDHRFGVVSEPQAIDAVR